MRIISGDMKGRKLYPIAGRSIRPTADRLRESLFNILADRVRGATVLDLFAGTGALGIEAISRGAEFALFLDKHKQAVSLIERNIHMCAIEGKAQVIQWDVIRNLNCVRSSQHSFDIVFMDPPYNINAIKAVLYNLHHSQCLETGATIVAEHSTLEPIPDKHPAFSIQHQRTYGKTLVSFLQYMV